MRQRASAARGCATCGGTAAASRSGAERTETPAIDNLSMQHLLSAGRIHARLDIGRPDDPLEHQADLAADQVTRGRLPRGAPVACTSCREQIFRKPATGSLPAPATRGELGLGAGHALDGATRRTMERGFGRDFGAIRIHTDAAAASSAAQIRARAYTAGDNIVFARGQYSPGTRNGDHLLAHELAHVVQQSGGRAPAMQRDFEDAAATDIVAIGGQLVDAVRARQLALVSGILVGKSIPDLQYLNYRVHEEVDEWLHFLLVRVVRGAELIRSASAWGALAPGGGLSLAAISSLGDAVTPAVAGATAEQGLRALWPSLSLLDRVEVYDEGYREIEQAQLDVIRSASEAERAEALTETVRLDAMYARMEPKEEYDARMLIDPAHPRTATEHLIDRGMGVISDEEDEIANAFLAMNAEDRRAVWASRRRVLQIYIHGGDYDRLARIAIGNEVDAINARLEFATEWRSDEVSGIDAAVEAAAQLMAERRRLRASIAAGTLSEEEANVAAERLRVLDELNPDAAFAAVPSNLSAGDSPLEQAQSMARAMDASPFMTRLIAAADSPDQFAAWAFRLGADPMAIARRRILMSSNTFSVDVASVQRAIIELRAPPVPTIAGESDADLERRQTEANNELRRRLLTDPDVLAVVNRLSDTMSERSDRQSFFDLANADRFTELWRVEFTTAVGNWDQGEMFRLAMMFCSRQDWHWRFEEKIAEMRGPFGALSLFARIPAGPRAVIESIVASGIPPVMPVSAVLESTDDIAALRAALTSMGEPQRAQLRRGYLLVIRGESRLVGDDLAAYTAYRDFEARLRASQASSVLTAAGVAPTETDDSGVQDIIDEVIGAAPTAAEAQTPEGRYGAAEIMQARQNARRGLDRGLSASWTETDETMDAAARQFSALFMRFSDVRRLSAVDFAALAALHDTFMSRSGEFTAASNQIGEIAGMVASTIAGILVVAATGGAATPAVIAAAAAAGAGSRVLTREMFGGDYYNPSSEAGTRDAILGALDGALAIVGSALAARGTQMLGLGGHALTSAAARAGGQVAEQASMSLSRRVAAGAVEAALDGAFSGAVSEAAGTLLDPRAWRQGIWHGLVSVGQSALLGGLTGLATGAVIGGALPVAGAGVRWVMDAVTAAGIERRLAGLGLERTLADLRAASHAGHVDDANRLFRQLEEHLTPQQAQALWREMAGNFETNLARMEGVAAPRDAEQARLLAESRDVRDGHGLSDAQRAAEEDIVSRSTPRETDEPGYVDEVSLGEGHHTWRRRADGTWCRFSFPSLCGTRIAGTAPPRSPVSLESGPPASFGSPTRVAGLDDLRRVLGGGPTTTGDQLFDVLPHGRVFEFPDGTRVWREGGGIRHDSPIRTGAPRADTEEGLWLASVHGNPRVAGMERAHTLGRGTGFESPFGIFYAPREVNQIIQNNGIEEFMRGLRDTAESGEQFFVSTFTAAHPRSQRLSQVHYRIEVARPGRPREVLFEYGINVSNDVPPRVTHGVTFETADDALRSMLGRVDIPSRLRARFAARGVHGAIPHAGNYADIEALLGRPFDAARLPPDYIHYRRTDGRLIIRRPADTEAFQALTVTRNAAGEEIVVLAPPRE